MATRPAAIAGSFYPASARDLQAEVTALLADNPCPTNRNPPKAVIAPHAGYVYSGPTAAKVYNLLRPIADRIKRVILLGPAHRVPLSGMALPESDAFETPLGTVPVDAILREKVGAVPGLCISERAHAMEHSLEVHLPFLQFVLHEFTLLPIVVGHTEPAAIENLLAPVWGGEETLVVISTDLSHFHDYQAASLRDRSTCEKILGWRSELAGEEACGCYPVNGMLRAGSNRGMPLTG